MKEPTRKPYSTPHAGQLIAAAFPFLCQVTLEHIQESLRPLGIRPIVLKGPHLAHTVYDKPSERTWTDLDLLVLPADFLKALDTLQAAGCRLAAPMPGRAATDTNSYCRALRSPLNIQVELHRDVTPHRCWPVDLAGWKERAIHFRIGEVEALGLGTEDLLLHLCLHIIKSHFWVEEKHIRDIGRLLNGRAIDWKAFLGQARSARCRAGCHYILRAAILQHGAPVPDAILLQTRPGALRRFWMNRFLDPARFPIYRFSAHSPQRMAMFLHFPLMDRPMDWPGFALRYSALRLKDAVARPLIRTRRVAHE